MEKKKGASSWAPAQKLKVPPIPGFRQRWVDKDPANVQKKQAEGWDFDNKSEHSYREQQDGKNLSTVNEYRELVLMKIPEEVAQERDAYFQAITDRQTIGLKEDLDKQMQSEAARDGKPGVRARGRIVIE